jgi:hypothetical protein
LDARVASPPDELERQADRVRGQIGATLDQLRTKLTPRNIVGEIAEGGGLLNLTPRSFVDFAARRHPVSTVLVGVGLGVLAFSVLRSSEKSGRGVLRETLGALAQSARNSFQTHAAAKREDFVRAAEAQLSAGAEQVRDAVEKGVGELVSRSPAPPEARPLVESALQLLLIAALETILAKAKK